MIEKHKQDLASRYGFAAYDELLAASLALPKSPGEAMQSYAGKHPNGHWFIWQDVPPKNGEKTATPLA